MQSPDFTKNYNRYGYCLNNPLVYVDPDGEIAWFVPIIIGAAIFGTGNLTAHAIRGDVNSFGDGLKYFGQGALAGAALGAAWQFAPLIPGIGQGIQTGMTIYGKVHLAGAAVSTVSGLGQGIFTGDWNALGNAGKIFLGNFSLDENRSFFGGVWQGFSRHTIESPQSILGSVWSQLRNTFWSVRVDYFGGATFVTNENRDNREGISLGPFININMQESINTKFDEYIISDPLFMHEYGHTFDSHIFSLFYLPVIGSFSVFGAEWTERKANRHAASYFWKYYQVGWDEHEEKYPR